MTSPNTDDEHILIQDLQVLMVVHFVVAQWQSTAVAKARSPGFYFQLLLTFSV